MYDLSEHVIVRMAQRNLDEAQINYVIEYGQCFHRAGACIYYLRKRDIPEWDRADDRWMRLAGTAVVLTKDGRRVITTWRNQDNGLKHLKRKSKWSGSHLVWRSDSLMVK